MTVLVAAETLKAGDHVVLPNRRYVEVTKVTNGVYEAPDAFPGTPARIVRVYYQALDGEVGVFRRTPSTLVEKEFMT